MELYEYSWIGTEGYRVREYMVSLNDSNGYLTIRRHRKVYNHKLPAVILAIATEF